MSSAKDESGVQDAFCPIRTPQGELLKSVGEETSTYIAEDSAVEKECYEVRLIGTNGGILYQFPGVGTRENKWAIDTRSWRMEHIVSRFLVQLEKTEEGLQVKKELDKDTNVYKPVLSEGVVSAFVGRGSQAGACRLVGHLGEVADRNGFVQVMFADLLAPQLAESIEAKPMPSFDGVQTPPTPPRELSD